MTTVVFDGVTLASESRRTTEDTIDPFASAPKFTARNGVVFAGAGTELWTLALVEWYGSKKPYPLYRDPGEDFSEVVVYDKGRWKHYFSSTPYPQPGAFAWAIGTGADFALSALLCGKSAPEAVAIAMQLDKNSGGPIFAANLARLIAEGDAAISEFGNVQADGKSCGASAFLHPGKVGRDSGVNPNGQMVRRRRGDCVRD